MCAHSSQVKHPTRVHLLRGNHEFHAQNVTYGFSAEVHGRGALLFGTVVAADVYRAFHECFNWMPFCALINNKILCMHGGISRHLHRLEQVCACLDFNTLSTL
jgi:diadenosine tetraphosphatase ApaH/serine/threonine PP2A family protein phosphatase